MIGPFGEAYVRLDDAVRERDRLSVCSAAARLAEIWRPMYRDFGYFPPMRRRSGAAQGPLPDLTCSVAGGDVAWSRLMDRMGTAVSRVGADSQVSAAALPSEEAVAEIRLVVVLLHEHQGQVTRSDQVVRVCSRLARALPQDPGEAGTMDPREAAACTVELHALALSGPGSGPAVGAADAAALRELIALLDEVSRPAAHPGTRASAAVARVRELTERLRTVSGRSLTVGTGTEAATGSGTQPSGVTQDRGRGAPGGQAGIGVVR